MMMLASTAMPTVSTRPAIPGSVSDASNAGQDRDHVEHVQDHRDVRDEPGQPVVDQHEQDDGRRADVHRELGLLDRVAPHRRADLGLEGLAQRRRQRARAEHRDQVLGLLLKRERIAEAAQRDAAARADAALDHRRAVDLVVEEDGHLAADVVAGHALGDRRALAVELERDLGPPGLLIPGLVGVRQVLAGQRRALVQVVGAPVACRASARRRRRAPASPRSRSRDRRERPARRSGPAKNFCSASRLFERR